MRVNITSDRKGGNPGGYATVDLGSRVADVYFKYVNSSRISPEVPFRVGNQPIYEALTLQMAKKLGLSVPKVGILRSDSAQWYRDGRIERPSSEYVFLSEIVKDVDIKGEEAELFGDEKLREEKVYRDMLLIGDVEGRRQNYSIIGESESPRLIYIDCGCGFVDAKEGAISQRNAITKLTRDVRSFEPLRNLRKRLKDGHKFLARKEFFTNHDVYSQQRIGCDDLVANIGSYRIPIFGGGFRRVDTIISDEEVDEIRDLMTMNMVNVVRKYKQSEVFQ